MLLAGLSLVHNADIVKDLGYYYRGHDLAEGADGWSRC